jgi:hypothetical protein
MKHGVIRFSETGDRWDAGFHLLRQEMEPRTRQLEETVSREDALARLDRVPLRFKQALLALGRGSSPRRLDTRSVDVIQREYPHLSLAVLESRRDESVSDLETEAARIRQAVEALDRLGDPSPVSEDVPSDHVEDHVEDHAEASDGLRAGWIYPLGDPDRYWDEDDAERYGIDPDKRYSYARVPAESDPGECYLVDMWIVDEEGRIHPGYDACPVPIQKQDLDITRGRPGAGTTPRPRNVFDSDWLRR